MSDSSDLLFTERTDLPRKFPTQRAGPWEGLSPWLGAGRARVWRRRVWFQPCLVAPRSSLTMGLVGSGEAVSCPAHRLRGKWGWRALWMEGHLQSSLRPAHGAVSRQRAVAAWLEHSQSPPPYKSPRTTTRVPASLCGCGRRNCSLGSQWEVEIVWPGHLFELLSTGLWGTSSSFWASRGL